MRGTPATSNQYQDNRALASQNGVRAYCRHTQLGLASSVLAVELGDGFGLPAPAQAVELCSRDGQDD